MHRFALHRIRETQPNAGYGLLASSIAIPILSVRDRRAGHKA
jgi:hypothetical protein